MSNVTTVGIDLAKNVFSLHGVDANGAVVLRKTVSRARLMELVAQQPACLIGLEACSGAHEWARRFQALGQTVKLMAPRFVAPYRNNGKNDGNDAEAICEALEQQAVLCLHRCAKGSSRNAPRRSIGCAVCWLNSVSCSRETAARTHHRPRRSLLANAARHGRPQRAAACEQSIRSAVAVGTRRARGPRLPPSLHRHRR
jgi:hypothetical protein